MPPLSWRDVPGWFDFADVYDAAVNAAPPKGAHFVEIGAALGRSTLYMAERIAASRKKIQFDAIDTWCDDFPRDIVAKAVDKHGGFRTAFEFYVQGAGAAISRSIYRVQGDQVAAAARYTDESLDFVFIDADHSYKTTAATIQAFLPKLRAGGTLAGHDYTRDWPDVVRAVNELLPGHTVVGNCFRLLKS